MHRNKVIVQQGGISFAGLLMIMLIGLKLTGLISLSWFWVLFPLWLALGAIGGAAVGLGIFYLHGWWQK